MIEGVKIDVSSAELEQHLRERVAHHGERTEFYRGQVDALREGGVGQQAATNDPISSLEQSAKHHADRAAFFRFLADHVVPKQTYRLSEQDLTRIEVIGRYL